MNLSGALGDGDACGQVCITPSDVPGLASEVVSIAAGSFHGCAIIAAGGLKCWGGNSGGQLGDGGACGEECPPVDVAGLETGVAAVAVGDFHTCAVTTAGGAKCWGLNNAGQLGDGGGCSEDCPPADVVGLESGVAAVTAGAFHTCALTTGGAVKCWGDNSFGELGLGASDSGPHPVPEDVVGLEHGITGIDAGALHVCALTVTGGVKCWGDNSYGQLGDGQACISATGCPRPVDVIGLGAKAAPTPTPTAPEATATSTMPSATAPEPAATSTRPAVEGLPVTGTGGGAGRGTGLFLAALLAGTGIAVAAYSMLRLLRRERAP
jgi:alpha-tubulin suppressor-like RCC1 family protein